MKEMNERLGNAATNMLPKQMVYKEGRTNLFLLLYYTQMHKLASFSV